MTGMDAAIPTQPCSAPTGFLVVSDLHLGASLRAPLNGAALRRVVLVDRELERFVNHHLEHRPGEHSDGQWTLVLNGDTFDFMHMDLRPDTEGWLERDEATFGLEYTSPRARWKLATMARYHRRTFKALGRFVAAGHRLVFVVGNHDADLHFPGVRLELIEHLSSHVEAGQRESVRAGVKIARWFYFEPGQFYVEHGHRFDPYTTFDDPIVPRAFGRAMHLATSFTHLASRYFANRIRTLPLHDLDQWKLFDFVRWGLRKGNLPVGQMLSQYVSLAARSVRVGLDFQRTVGAHLKNRQRARLARLKAYSRVTRLPLEALRKIDALGVKPLTASAVGGLQALYVGHVGLGLLAVLAAITSAIIVEGWLMKLAASASVLLSTALFMRVFATWLRPDPDVHPRLGQAARRIAEETGAPVVVFGHTHRPVHERSEGRHWLNPGAWDHAWRKVAVHTVEARCTCGLRFARVTRDETGVDAQLVHWCSHFGRPQETGAPERLLPPV